MVNIQKVSKSDNDNTISVKENHVQNQGKLPQNQAFRLVNHIITYFMNQGLWLHRLSLPVLAIKKHIHSNWKNPVYPFGSLIILSGTVLLLGTAPLDELEPIPLKGAPDVPTGNISAMTVELNQEFTDVEIQGFIQQNTSNAEEVAQVYGIPKSLIMSQMIYSVFFSENRIDKIDFEESLTAHERKTYILNTISKEDWHNQANRLMNQGGTILLKKFGNEAQKWALGLDHLDFSSNPVYGKQVLLIMKHYNI